MIDYFELLVKYMNLVRTVEGYDYLDCIGTADYPSGKKPEFSQGDLEHLLEIRGEITARQKESDEG